jgi:hypothetical protein
MGDSLPPRIVPLTCATKVALGGTFAYCPLKNKYQLRVKSSKAKERHPASNLRAWLMSDNQYCSRTTSHTCSEPVVEDGRMPEHFLSVLTKMERRKTTDGNDLHKTSSRDLEPCYSIYKTKDDSEDERYAKKMSAVDLTGVDYSPMMVKTMTDHHGRVLTPTYAIPIARPSDTMKIVPYHHCGTSLYAFIRWKWTLACGR